MNIYQIKESYRQLQELATSGEVSGEELNGLLDIIDTSLNDKAENYGLVMKNIETLVNGYKAEIDRLSALKRSAELSIQSIKDSLAFNLKDMKVDKLQTEHFKYSFRKSESVDVKDIDSISEQYKKEKVTVTADKTAIKKALKAGEIVEGAVLIEKQNLQIK